MLNKHFSVPHSKLLHAEWLVLWSMFVTIGVAACGYPLLVPTPQTGVVGHLLSIGGRYTQLLGGIAVLYTLSKLCNAYLIKKLEWKKLALDLLVLFRVTLCFMVALYIMQCFKWWSHLHTPLYGTVYWKIDLILQPLKNLCFAVEQFTHIPQIWYLYGLTLFFLIPYIISILLKPDVFLSMATTNIAIMLLGGMAYAIAPAYGPLLVELSHDTIIGGAQKQMLSLTEAFRNSNGDSFPAESFDAALGAMPSLHVAHAAAITLIICNFSRILGILCLISLLFICSYSVVTHFHYLIDIPFGFLLAYIAVKFANFQPTSQPVGLT